MKKTTIIGLCCVVALLTGYLSASEQPVAESPKELYCARVALYEETKDLRTEDVRGHKNYLNEDCK